MTENFFARIARSSMKWVREWAILQNAIKYIAVAITRRCNPYKSTWLSATGDWHYGMIYRRSQQQKSFNHCGSAELTLTSLQCSSSSPHPQKMLKCFTFNVKKAIKRWLTGGHFMTPLMYLNNMFTLNKNSHSRKHISLIQPKFNTKKYGFNSIRCQSSRLWNQLDNEYRNNDKLKGWEPHCTCATCDMCILLEL